MEIHIFSFKKTHLKISSVEWRPQCVDNNAITASICYVCPKRPQGSFKHFGQDLWSFIVAPTPSISVWRHCWLVRCNTTIRLKSRISKVLCLLCFMYTLINIYCRLIMFDNGSKIHCTSERKLFFSETHILKNVQLIAERLERWCRDSCGFVFLIQITCEVHVAWYHMICILVISGKLPGWMIVPLVGWICAVIFL